MGVNKINDKFSLMSDLPKVNKLNKIKESPNLFLDILLNETSTALPIGERFQLNLIKNEKYTGGDKLKKDELKRELIRESAELNLSLPERKIFNGLLDQGLELAKNLIELKRENVSDMKIENPIVGSAFKGLYKDLIAKNGLLPDKLTKVFIKELETINEKVETELEEKIYLDILDHIKSDKSFNMDSDKTFTELRLDIHEDMNIAIDENGKEILDKPDEILFELIDRAESLDLNKDELNLFTKLIDNKDIILTETFIEMKDLKILDNKSMRVLEEGIQNQDIPNIEKMSLIEKGLKGLLEGDEVRELIKLIGKFNLLKFGLESHLTFRDYEELYSNRESTTNTDIKPLIEGSGEVLISDNQKLKQNSPTLQTLMNKALKAELQGDEIIKFIKMIGKDNLLKYGLESYAPYIRDG